MYDVITYDDHVIAAGVTLLVASDIQDQYIQGGEFVAIVEH